MRACVGAMDGSATGGPWGGVKGFGFGECIMLCCVVLCRVMSCLFLLCLLHITCLLMILFVILIHIIILEFRSRSGHCGWGSDGSGRRCYR